MPLAAIFDCEGPRPSAEERAFFRDADPWGFILFARHCADAAAVATLCAELRDIVGREAPILIDQEGGRVARMKPPAFPAHPPPAAFGELWKLDPERARAAARRNAFLIARMIADLGVDVNCTPMLDVPQIDSDPTVIGDRALARHPEVVAELGRAVIEGTLDGGALPVIKHLPGHGRALVDSHHALPRIGASRSDLERTDFAPFRALNNAPIGMTGHVVIEAIDPERPATLSPAVIGEVIRESIGFDGLLITDDLKMNALGGPLGARAGAAIAAGCDIALCCNFPLADKIAAATATPALAGAGAGRAERALAQRRPGAPADLSAAYAALAADLKPVAA